MKWQGLHKVVLSVKHETLTGEKVEGGAIPNIWKGWMGLRTRRLGLGQTTINPKNKGTLTFSLAHNRTSWTVLSAFRRRIVGVIIHGL